MKSVENSRSTQNQTEISLKQPNKSRFLSKVREIYVNHGQRKKYTTVCTANRCIKKTLHLYSFLYLMVQFNGLHCIPLLKIRQVNESVYSSNTSHPKLKEILSPDLTQFFQNMEMPSIPKAVIA